MTLETTRRRPDHQAVRAAPADRAAPARRGAPERRAEALVAAYIHELSPRHRSEREAGKTGPGDTPAI